jgi:hypothetical protein
MFLLKKYYLYPCSNLQGIKSIYKRGDYNEKTLATVACALTLVIGLSVLPSNTNFGILQVDTVSAATGETETHATPSNHTTTLKITKLYQGLENTITFRNGPGKDSEGIPVYSFTLVEANATFDADVRIVNTYIDSYEVSTPNYDGKSMPHFSGWPGEEGYNVTAHETEKVTGFLPKILCW